MRTFHSIVTKAKNEFPKDSKSFRQKAVDYRLFNHLTDVSHEAEEID